MVNLPATLPSGFVFSAQMAAQYVQVDNSAPYTPTEQSLYNQVLSQNIGITTPNQANTLAMRAVANQRLYAAMSKSGFSSVDDYIDAGTILQGGTFAPPCDPVPIRNGVLCRPPAGTRGDPAYAGWWASFDNLYAQDQAATQSIQTAMGKTGLADYLMLAAVAVVTAGAGLAAAGGAAATTGAEVGAETGATAGASLTAAPEVSGVVGDAVLSNAATTTVETTTAVNATAATENAAVISGTESVSIPGASSIVSGAKTAIGAVGGISTIRNIISPPKPKPPVSPPTQVVPNANTPNTGLPVQQTTAPTPEISGGDLVLLAVFGKLAHFF